MNDLTVIMIGGGGAVGRAVIERVASERLIVVDRSPAPPGCEVDWREADLTDIGAVEELIAKLPNRFHLLLLAANLSNDVEFPGASRALSDNLLGTANPIIAAGANIAHVTLVSSISVYGVPDQNPVREDHCRQPATLYGTGKAASETLVGGLCRLHNIGLTILRPAQLFGLASAAATLPHVLVQQAAAGNVLRLFGSAEDQRDYLWVGDFADLLVRQVNSPIPGKFNVGSGQPRKLREMFERSAARFGVDIVTEQLAGAASFDQWLDTSAIESAFDLGPRLDVLTWIDHVAPDSPYQWPPSLSPLAGKAAAP